MNKTYIRLDNQSFNEEIEKAKLRLSNSAWNTSLDKVEVHRYLWGQIRCLLNWSENDIEKFDDYGKRLMEILDAISTDARKYYCAILSFVPDSWRDTNRLFLYNKDRDNSFKRFLREHTREGQTYGQTLKSLIDNWKVNYATLSASEYFDKLIIDKKETAESWIRVILRKPEIIDEAWNKRVYTSNGHVILAQRKTSDSHCFDPVLLYFRACCVKNSIEHKFYDSKGDWAHAFECKINGHKYQIRWQGESGRYSVVTDNQVQNRSAEELLKFMDDIINPV